MPVAVLASIASRGLMAIIYWLKMPTFWSSMTSIETSVETSVETNMKLHEEHSAPSQRVYPVCSTTRRAAAHGEQRRPREGAAESVEWENCKVLKSLDISVGRSANGHIWAIYRRAEENGGRSSMWQVKAKRKILWLYSRPVYSRNAIRVVQVSAI